MFDSVATLAADLDAFARAKRGAAHGSPTVSTEAGRLILLLAAGKRADIPGVEANDARRMQSLSEAARRVVAEVFLSVHSNHFVTLGLSPNADNATIREHFRRLMAVVHPDAKPVGFPGDAAARVNHAYALLSNEETKSAYLDALTQPASESTAVESGAQRVARGPRAPLPPRARWRALLDILRSRHALLWFAVVLLAPVVLLFVSSFQRADPVRLVEARPGDGGAGGTGWRRDAVPPTADAPNAMTGAAVLQTPVIAPPGTDAGTPRLDGMSLTSGLSTRSLELLSAKRPARQPPENNRPLAKTSAESTPATSLAPTAPSTSPATSNTVTGSVANPADASLRQPLPMQRDPQVAAAAVSVSAATAPTAVAGTQTIAAASPASSARAPSTAGQASIRDAELDDLLLRFANAYESGSIAGFAQLLSSTMTGRRQMLAEYERVFSATRSRTIKFNQLKHSTNGERVSTAGYATVTTIDQDNRSSTQRVFLEFDIGRDRGEARIERLANYAIN